MSLFFTARAGVDGIVARQRLLLRPGRYQLSYVALLSEGASLGASTLEIMCLPGEKRVTQGPIRETSGALAAVGFTIPGGCESQVLAVVAKSGTSETGVDGVIDSIAIRPAALQ